MTPALNASLSLHEFQQGLLPLIVGIVLAILLSFIIRETGVGSLSFPKTPSGQIRTMRQNQRIIRHDACDPASAREVWR
jgi:hypothetical protein